MSERHVDPTAVLGDLKDFQRRTAVWAFERMFHATDPTTRFLVADEVGLGKTHIAKGVIAQVIDHLQRGGDERHDIVYVCSNGAIARQNLRKLVPKGIEPLDDVERLTMLPLAQLDQGGQDRSGVNLLAITPGTSLKFGRNTGKFEERCLAYAYLRALWGADVMSTRNARRVFWGDVTVKPDERLRAAERTYRPAVQRTLPDFTHVLAEIDDDRRAGGQPDTRELFDELVQQSARKWTFPEHLLTQRAELIGDVRKAMAIVGISALRPDLVVLDEFQRFKDLLDPDPANFAAELAHRLFNYEEPDTGRPTRTLLLSATPYRMFTTADEVDGDHYADFLATCGFLFGGHEQVDDLRDRFSELRHTLTSPDTLDQAQAHCQAISAALRNVMARTERLAATPDRDGMLCEQDVVATVEADDLRSFLRFGAVAEAVEHHEPTEYWKAGPYLLNFMEKYKFKEAFDRGVQDGLLPDGEQLEPGPGLLDWQDVERYREIDPQNGRLRWLLSDLDAHRAFELLWIPPSTRYYDTGSVYESVEATSFTKRLIFSGWAVVPKVVSSLVSYEAERRAYASRSHRYSADYRRRGGQRLAFRTVLRTAQEARPGEADTPRRAAAMTAFLLLWPSPTLAEAGDPRGALRSSTATELLDAVEERLRALLDPLLRTAPHEGVVDQRWYWAAPLFLDQLHGTAAVDLLLAADGATYWENEPGEGFQTHHAEARALLDHGVAALGRPPEDLVAALAEVAVGSPAICALRAVASVTGLPLDHHQTLYSATWTAAAFRSFFNAPEVTALVASGIDGNLSTTGDATDETSRYWQDVVRHNIGGNLQALLDEHTHVLRDWLSHINLDDETRRIEAADDIANHIADALDVRTSTFRVDIPRLNGASSPVRAEDHRLRTRFAVPFGHQTLEGGGEARVESVSDAFNSPFWPFVLTSTSVGQEGLDFHLWCHAVVHWNLPSNPVDLEQREGRVHRYKGHAVRRNIAATLGPDLLSAGTDDVADLWDELFTRAAATRADGESEMVPYWVFHQGPARIERHVPVLPFSKDAAALPRLRKTLAAYRLAFGQPRQEELIEYLGANRSDTDLSDLAATLRIDLTPPPV